MIAPSIVTPPISKTRVRARSRAVNTAHPRQRSRQKPRFLPAADGAGLSANFFSPNKLAQQVLPAIALFQKLLLRRIHPLAAEFIDGQALHNLIITVLDGDGIGINHSLLDP